MKGRKLVLLLAGLLVATAFTGVAGCWFRRGRVYVPRVRVRAPVVTVRAPVVYSTPVVRVAPPVRRVYVTRACPVGYYWLRGRYRYYAGRYLWVAGRCTPVPVAYRARRCRYYPGRWVRVSYGWRRLRGSWRCY